MKPVTPCVPLIGVHLSREDWIKLRFLAKTSVFPFTSKEYADLVRLLGAIDHALAEWSPDA